MLDFATTQVLKLTLVRMKIGGQDDKSDKS